VLNAIAAKHSTTRKDPAPQNRLILLDPGTGLAAGPPKRVADLRPIPAAILLRFQARVDPSPLQPSSRACGDSVESPQALVPLISRAFFAKNRLPLFRGAL
jgi:hypothetical protein